MDEILDRFIYPNMQAFRRRMQKMGQDVLYPPDLNHEHSLESSAAGEPLPVPGSILRLAGEGALTIRNDVS